MGVHIDDNTCTERVCKKKKNRDNRRKNSSSSFIFLRKLYDATAIYIIGNGYNAHIVQIINLEYVN